MLVGTSGFAYPHWNGTFYPEGLAPEERLAYYAGRFPTVELNVTFYRTPPAKTFAAWRDEVPPEFCFAVKASRYLTHTLRLRHPREPVEYLMERATALGDRLGPILVQLPPDLSAAFDRLDATLAAFGPEVRVAVEPRHPSWFTDELRALLKRRDAALCIADRRRPITPLWQTASWLYVRLHEGRGSPRSCYGREALASWARRLVELAGPDPAGYVYFNNDAHGCAIRNASAFEEALARAKRGSHRAKRGSHRAKRGSHRAKRGSHRAKRGSPGDHKPDPRLQAEPRPVYSDASSAAR